MYLSIYLYIYLQVAERGVECSQLLQLEGGGDHRVGHDGGSRGTGAALRKGSIQDSFIRPSIHSFLH